MQLHRLGLLAALVLAGCGDFITDPAPGEPEDGAAPQLVGEVMASTYAMTTFDTLAVPVTFTYQGCDLYPDEYGSNWDWQATYAYHIESSELTLTSDSTYAFAQEGWARCTNHDGDGYELSLNATVSGVFDYDDASATLTLWLGTAAEARATLLARGPVTADRARFRGFTPYYTIGEAYVSEWVAQ